jgi:lipopolysaccharide export system ATP-binding protein
VPGSPAPDAPEASAPAATPADGAKPPAAEKKPESPPAAAEFKTEQTLMLPPGSMKIPMPSEAEIAAFQAQQKTSSPAAVPAATPLDNFKVDETLRLPPGAVKIPMPSDSEIAAAQVATLIGVEPAKAQPAETAPSAPPASPPLNDGAAEPTVVKPPAQEVAAVHGGNGNGAKAPESATSPASLAAAAVASPTRSAFLPPVDTPFAPAPETIPLPPETSIIGLPSASSYQLRRVMAAPPKPPPEPLLKAQGLTKRFGKREVVRGVEIGVGPGEIVGLLGRNGAGKTTTFRMVMGMLQPDSGSVRFDNREITRLPMYARANRGLGYLAQEPSVFQKLTVEDNLLAVLELQVSERKIRLAKLDELIHALGLETVRKSRAATLSGGERRRLEIARAMTLSPKIVLFDEPFAGIDPIAVNEIQNILRDLKRAGVGVLLTDHNVRETLNITDRTYIMDEGVIWIHGSPREIVNHPEARKRYLGHDFRLDF